MDAQTLSDVMGGTLSLSRYQELLPGYENAASAAQINNLERAAQWAAQLGHESVGLRYMEEIADGSAYNGRADLGNTQPGDGPRFKGRGPIQLTGRNNYRAFTRWARDTGQSTIDFEAEPWRLSEPHWGFLAASYYWVVARPGINAAADQGYTLDVTRMINGGTNGIDDRRARYNRAKAMGARIIPATGGAAVQTVEKVLPYSRAEVRQDTYYWCGPATTQMIIHARTGPQIPEAQLAKELGTTVNGTNGVGQIARVLNARIGGGWVVRNMHNDPPTNDQREQLWRDVVGSINGGVGVAINIWAPTNNYPKASYTSTVSPAYGGGFVMHYIAAMGYAVDAGGQRHVWIADSGFSPYGYWCTLNQLATLIPPREYAIASEWQGDTSTEGDWSDMASKEEIRQVVREEIAAFCGPIGHDTKRLAIQFGLDADDDGFGRVPGWVQGGHRALYDLVSAIAEKAGVPRTKDTLPEAPKNARNPKLKG